MADLLDASVWLPLCAPDHVHHGRALRYWQLEAADELAFCRLTALALLRYLTNPRILGETALDGLSAWHALKTLLSMPRVNFFDEPEGIDDWLARWAEEFTPRAGEWSDTYLAAFAAASDCRLVAFDADFQRYKTVKFLHLKL